MACPRGLPRRAFGEVVRMIANITKTYELVALCAHVLGNGLAKSGATQCLTYPFVQKLRLVQCLQSLPQRPATAMLLSTSATLMRIGQCCRLARDTQHKPRPHKSLREADVGCRSPFFLLESS
eukprot:scaffold748_cov251-Pinguiococcus_pyrenoidosus.AAC.30